LRIPSQLPSEIEKIVNLQAPSFLPYPANELVTGFQIIASDRQGHCGVNLVIAHRGAIERMLAFFEKLQSSCVSIILSSYGLCNLYNVAAKNQTTPVMLLDIDSEQAEVVLVGNRKMFFSRVFRFSQGQPDRGSILVDEINKTRDVYIREVAQEAPAKIVLLGSRTANEPFIDILQKQTAYPFQVISYQDIPGLGESIAQRAATSDVSVASLLGLGLGSFDEYLELLPQAVKQQRRSSRQRQEYVHSTLLGLGLVLITAAAMTRHLDNKIAYLVTLKDKLGQVTRDAKPLEDIERRFRTFADQSQKRLSALDVLRELYQIVPAQVTLTRFTYEESNQISLHGQTPGMDAVFMFVSALEKSRLFENFTVKINYATQKKMQSGQAIDFEIMCSQNE
jgi:Tfp pilus assembly protein PilN